MHVSIHVADWGIALPRWGIADSQHIKFKSRPATPLHIKKNIYGATDILVLFQGVIRCAFYTDMDDIELTADPSFYIILFNLSKIDLNLPESNPDFISIQPHWTQGWYWFTHADPMSTVKKDIFLCSPPFPPLSFHPVCSATRFLRHDVEYVSL